MLPSAGTYFLNIDIAALGCDDDVAFCRDLVERRGVAAIPVSAFYAEAPIRTVARFCFAKRDATLDAALARLEGVASEARVVMFARLALFAAGLWASAALAEDASPFAPPPPPPPKIVRLLAPPAYARSRRAAGVRTRERLPGRI